MKIKLGVTFLLIIVALFLLTSCDDPLAPIINNHQTNIITENDNNYTITNTYVVTNLNPERYNIANNIVEDTYTGLCWVLNLSVAGIDESVQWFETTNNIITFNASSYGGYNDWKIPTAGESSSIPEEYIIHDSDCTKRYWTPISGYYYDYSIKTRNSGLTYCALRPVRYKY